MKTMTCKQLGGACDEQFQGNTFEEIVELSKHMQAMQKVMMMMQQPEVMKEYFAEKKKVFEALAED